MRKVENSALIVDGYLGMLHNLSLNNKLELISKLTDSIKSDLIEKKSSFKKSFGALDIKKSAEEIIEDIKSTRNFSRQIESF